MLGQVALTKQSAKNLQKILISDNQFNKFSLLKIGIKHIVNFSDFTFFCNLFIKLLFEKRKKKIGLFEC